VKESRFVEEEVVALLGSWRLAERRRTCAASTA
jgi:hypothetical protein